MMTNGHSCIFYHIITWSVKVLCGFIVLCTAQRLGLHFEYANEIFMGFSILAIVYIIRNRITTNDLDFQYEHYIALWTQEVDHIERQE